MVSTYGIDVSSFQANINFSTASGQGITFAIVKAGGYNVAPMYTSSSYATQIDRAIAAGMAVGHYWVTGNTSTQSVTAQADYFTAHLHSFDKNAQILALDNENLNGNGQLWDDAKVAAWINRVVANTGIDPSHIWIYMSASAIRAGTWTATNATGARWWVAAWGGNDGIRVTPDTGGKIPGWHVQQYWSAASVAGYTVDKNYSPYSIGDLFLAGGTIVDPIPEPPAPTVTDHGFGDNPEMFYDGTDTATTPPLGSNPTEVCVYRNGQWVVFWGSNANVPPPPPPPPPPGTARFTGSGALKTAATPSTPKPTAAFSYAQNSGTWAVTFTNTSSETGGSIVSSAWNFGDGTTSTSANPVHTYPASAATYTVKLTVTDGYGQTASVSKSVTTSPPPPPPAAFTYGTTEPTTSNVGVGVAGHITPTVAYTGTLTPSTSITIQDKIITGVIKPANSTTTITLVNCEIRLPASGLTVDTRAITNGSISGGGGKVVASFCTIHATAASLWVNGAGIKNITLDRCRIYNMVDGVDSLGGITLRGCLITDLLRLADPSDASGVTHNDGVQIVGGSGHTIFGCAIHGYNSSWSNVASKNNVSTTCIMLTPNYGAITNLNITYNWFYGGDYPVNGLHLDRATGNTGHIDHNRFNTLVGQTGHTIDLYAATSTGITTVGNTYMDGTPVTVRRV